ncbi:MAG: hypothetical protein M3N23_11780 [Pseudomonadota bacterium]|nr:hypothetical protein [Pseudomonadota bacterium]
MAIRVKQLDAIRAAFEDTFTQFRQIEEVALAMVVDVCGLVSCDDEFLDLP